MITLDISGFRSRFPEFADTTTYPDSLIILLWDEATCHISDTDYGLLRGDCRRLAIELMMCHIATINNSVLSGATVGVATSASIESVSVSLMAPPAKNQWQWWLAQTPCGQRLLALLTVKAAPGFSVGGLREGAAFRRVGGRFGR
jgi:hypothetical protein